MCYCLAMREQDKYLKIRGDTYYYQRRVPVEYRDFDDRKYIKKSLKTSNLEIARSRRDAFVEADNLIVSEIITKPLTNLKFRKASYVFTISTTKIFIYYRRSPQPSYYRRVDALLTFSKISY